VTTTDPLSLRARVAKPLRYYKTAFFDEGELREVEPRASNRHGLATAATGNLLPDMGLSTKRLVFALN
jgi:hypothetical protein